VWRLQKDARYNAWYDYDALVVTQTLDVPPATPIWARFSMSSRQSWGACIGFTPIRCNSRCAAAASCTCKQPSSSAL
jgi:hypothetical protein